MIIIEKKLQNNKYFQKFLEVAKPHREYLQTQETRAVVFENYLFMSLVSVFLFDRLEFFGYIEVLLFVIIMHLMNFFVWWKLADPQKMKQNAIQKSIEKQTS